MQNFTSNIGRAQKIDLYYPQIPKLVNHHTLLSLLSGHVYLRRLNALLFKSCIVPASRAICEIPGLRDHATRTVRRRVLLKSPSGG